MSFHTNRSTRHAESDRRITERLEQHKELMEKFQREGMTREQASERAYEIVTKESRCK